MRHDLSTEVFRDPLLLRFIQLLLVDQENATSRHFSNQFAVKLIKLFVKLECFRLHFG